VCSDHRLLPVRRAAKGGWRLTASPSHRPPPPSSPSPAPSSPDPITPWLRPSDPKHVAGFPSLLPYIFPSVFQSVFPYVFQTLDDHKDCLLDNAHHDEAYFSDFSACYEVVLLQRDDNQADLQYAHQPVCDQPRLP
jgi:hypothetical protein